MSSSCSAKVGSRKRFKGVQTHTCQNDLMHPRNAHKQHVDYHELGKAFPDFGKHLFTNRHGMAAINYNDYEACFQLTRALFKEHYNLDWTLPLREDLSAQVTKNCQNPSLMSGDEQMLAKCSDECPNDSHGCSKNDVGVGFGVVHMLDGTEGRYLCPTLPSRVNYIHYLADLCAEDLHRFRCANGSGQRDCLNVKRTIDNREDANFCQECLKDISSGNICALDIGVGANCVYSLLGASIYGWSFVGTDISDAALEIAKKNVGNNNLTHLIHLQHQNDAHQIVSTFLEERNTRQFCFTVCNPPFYSSIEEWGLNPVRRVEGKAHELVGVLGGELAFLRRMFQESTCTLNCLWYTCLISKLRNVKTFKSDIQQWNRECVSKQGGRAHFESISPFKVYFDSEEKRENIFAPQKEALKSSNVPLQFKTASQPSSYLTRSEPMRAKERRRLKRALERGKTAPLNVTCRPSSDLDGGNNNAEILLPGCTGLGASASLQAPEYVTPSNPALPDEDTAVIRDASADDEAVGTADGDVRAGFSTGFFHIPNESAQNRPVDETSSLALQALPHSALSSGLRTVKEVKVFSLYQGKQCRWVVAWTFFHGNDRYKVLQELISTQNFDSPTKCP